MAASDDLVQYKSGGGGKKWVGMSSREKEKGEEMGNFSNGPLLKNLIIKR